MVAISFSDLVLLLVNAVFFCMVIKFLVLSQYIFVKFLFNKKILVVKNFLLLVSKIFFFVNRILWLVNTY